MNVGKYNFKLKIKNEKIINLKDLLELIDRYSKIRLSSINPDADEFIYLWSKNPKLCQHFHISLQSGSDKILKKMNRKYRAKDFETIVRKIRKRMPGVSITTDIIVGFPGEKEDDFEETYKLIKDLNFAKIHVFRYSKVKGTSAEKFPEQIKSSIKKERTKKLIELSK